MNPFTHTIVEGLWVRFKGLALHRQDRLETAHDFVGWLEALPWPRLRGERSRADSQQWFACLNPDYYHPRLGLYPPAEDTSLLLL